MDNAVRVTVAAVLDLAALDKSDWRRALRQVLRIDSHALGVDRASYWHLSERPRAICCELGYVRSADAYEEGAVLLASDAWSYVRELAKAQVIIIEDVAADPRSRDLRAYCEARKISSMLDVPVWVDSKLIGVLCHEHVGPRRRWSAGEIDFTLSVAQVIATAAEKQRCNAAERCARRASLLSQASWELSRSLELPVVAERAVAGALPALGDWAALDLFEGGGVRRVAVHHHEESKQALLEQYAASFPPTLDGAHLTVQMHRLDQAAVVPDVTDEVLRQNGFTEDHIRALRALGLRSAIAVPARTPGSVDAVLMLISAERRYDVDALRLAEAYGERVAAALHSARLYQESQDALRARDEFLALAAHELRTPLTSLALSCERLVAATRDRDPEIAASGERVLRQSRRLSRLVNRMLEVSQHGVQRPLVRAAPVDLVPLVREVLDELSGSKAGAAIEVALPGSVVGKWDGERLQQVVGNLLDNALKYGGGRPVRLALSVERDVAVLSVADRGIGIDPEVIPRLFDLYERGVSGSGYGGLGLGLFIVRQIVAAHGGTVDVKSKKGEGSEFLVRLPGVIGGS